MKIAKFNVLLPLVAISLQGCASKVIERNHTNVREALLSYNEDQILDNIIRVYNRRPIMHFDINAANAQVKTVGSGGVGGGQTLERSANAFAAVGTSAIETIKATRPGTFTLGGSAEDTLSVEVKPVLNSNEVYTAYEAFAKEPGSVRVGDPGPNESIHVGKTWEDGRFYWIPSEFSEDYFQLALRTSVKRGNVPTAPKSSTRNSSSARLRDALESPDLTTPDPQRDAAEALDEQTRILRRLPIE